MTSERRESCSENAILGGRVLLVQPRRGHRVGHDAVLLAAATAAKPGERAVEFGAGVGAAGLALAARVPGLSITLLDVDEDLVALARENIERNGLTDRARAIALDVAAPARAFRAAGLEPASAQCVLMNPPFNDPARHRLSPDAARARAHAALPINLRAWFGSAARLLAPKGVMTLIWRADGLGQALAALPPVFGGVALRPVHARPDGPAIRVLLRAVRDSRAPLAILPGLVLNDATGQPTEAAQAILREGRDLPFG